jgi:hypothetical protein
MGSEATSMRQFHEIEDGEVSDLGDAITRTLVAELQRMVVAGAAQASTWALADELRYTLRHHHAAAFRRARGRR